MTVTPVTAARCGYDTREAIRVLDSLTFKICASPRVEA